MIRAATEEEIVGFEEKASYSPSRRAKGVVNEIDGKVVVMVVCDHWTFTAVQVHIWCEELRHLIDTKFLTELKFYLFDVCNREMIVAVTPEDSKGSLVVSTLLGFKETGRIKGGWAPGKDMIIKELKRDDCRWIQQKAA